MKTIEGRLQVSGRGFGFVIPADPAEPDIYIPRANMNDAMHGDQVLVRLAERAEMYGRKPEGWIIKVLQRANTQIVGTYESNRSSSFVKPADVKSQLHLFISCNINRPKFSSQTKENMVSLPTNYGTSVTISEKFIKKIIA